MGKEIPLYRTLLHKTQLFLECGPVNYFEDWFDEADDPVQFDHTAYFVEDLLDFAKDAYNDNRADLEYSTPKLTDISSSSEIGYVHKMRSLKMSSRTHSKK